MEDEDFLNQLPGGKALTPEERLMEAVDVDDYTKVEKCLAWSSLDVNAINDRCKPNASMRGLTAMHIAILKENFEVGILILEHPDYQIDVTDLLGRTALHYAAEHDMNGVLAKKLVNEGGAEVANMQDLNGQTALHAACYHGNIGLIRALFTVNQIDPYMLDNSRKTAMFHAVQNNELSALKELIDNEVSSVLPFNTSAVYSPLAWAIREHNLPMVDNLIKYGATTPTHACIKLKHQPESGLELPCIATLALNSCFAPDFKSLEPIIYLTKKVTDSSTSLASPESVFKLYTRYIKESSRGQNYCVSNQLRELGKCPPLDLSENSDDIPSLTSLRSSIKSLLLPYMEQCIQRDELDFLISKYMLTYEEDGTFIDSFLDG